MKKFKQLLCLALALTISASLLAACGQKNNGGSKDSDEKVLTYAVEGGSAGEEIALEKGWKVTTLEDQAAALMEVASGTSDAAIIDLLMAGAMIGEGTSYPDLTYTDRLTEEEYGIGCRKGSDLAQYINCVLGCLSERNHAEAGPAVRHHRGAAGPTTGEHLHHRRRQ